MQRTYTQLLEPLLDGSQLAVTPIAEGSNTCRYLPPMSICSTPTYRQTHTDRQTSSYVHIPHANTQTQRHTHTKRPSYVYIPHFNIHTDTDKQTDTHTHTHTHTHTLLEN